METLAPVTGLKIINGGGVAEAQAAHIQPVAKGGPDRLFNGIASVRDDSLDVRSRTHFARRRRKTSRRRNPHPATDREVVARRPTTTTSRRPDATTPSLFPRIPQRQRLQGGRGARHQNDESGFHDQARTDSLRRRSRRAVSLSETYLADAKRAVGDWCVYYETASDGGRWAYFGVAYVRSVDQDPQQAGAILRPTLRLR